ncbi:Maf-like protein [Legionella antarctica]|uniref:Nucleoside triphosphate pyrophosphatase n=1 Tax=Legionella antarctica TaxID=2708020 RepID=A0A6F8T822_9GAMM|nr:nucleoside triphosphate pyrophosphatase [Legionella antarctica]BCA96353.1 Maf-like protein [Legionella antarctica]
MSKFLQQQPLILASGSSIRSKLLNSLGLQFSVIPSNCDEEALKKMHQSKSIVDLGFALAKTKALDVSQHHPEYFVIAADQLCVIDNKILDKPLNHQTATKHLQLLSGKKHQQIACVCIAKNNEIIWQQHDIATLSVRNLNEQEIDAYLHGEQPYYSCGAYHYETQGKWLFTEVIGNEDTILGLPLMPLTNALQKLGAVHLI